MADYYPILKAKQGELNALHRWDPAQNPHVHPVMEVVPWERTDLDNSAEEDQVEIDKAAHRLAYSWEGKTSPLYVDSADAEPDLSAQEWHGSAPVLLRVVRALLQKGVDAAPVVRVSADVEYVEAIRPLVAELGVARALIRITSEDLDDTVTPLGTLVARTARTLGIVPEQVVVLLDFGAVGDDGAMAMASRLARFVLPQLAGESWAGLVVAAGAFPVNLSSVQPYEVQTLPRYDLRVWRNLNSFELPNGFELAFGDYAVTHPVLPTGVAFAAPPQLRYTQNDSWLVAKGRRQDRRGHRQFFSVCEDVIAVAGADATPAAASWGDEYIHRAALAAHDDNSTLGPGNASTWRAIATSHHLAHTANQLRAEAAL
jgi:hypothetical protein